MLIESRSGGIAVIAPAKLNLFLAVHGKRSDGYHEIETLMCPISLCDELEFHVRDEPEIRLEVELPEAASNPPKLGRTVDALVDAPSPAESDPAWDIPTDQRNLAFRAVQRVRECLGTNLGCVVRLKKRIPAAAGLGGGSSDAAAAVVAAMISWGAWDRILAAQICSELGSDLNVFLGDKRQIGFTLAKGRGEVCEVISVDSKLDFLLTHPPAGCSTRAVYANWQKTVDANWHSVIHANWHTADQKLSGRDIVSACVQGNVELIGPLLFNSLEESARAITPWIDKQLNFFRDCGMRYPVMTGSGSSCFALLAETCRMADTRLIANDAGLTRLYAVKSWVQPSIEDQVRLIAS